MNIKRYHAPDMRRALKKVSEDLGSEAVILSNRKTANGVELWASGGTPAEANNSPHIPAPSHDVSESGKKKGEPTVKARRASRGLEQSIERLRKNGKVLLERELANGEATGLSSEVGKGNRSGKTNNLKKRPAAPETAQVREEGAVASADVVAMREELASVRSDLRQQSALLTHVMQALQKSTQEAGVPPASDQVSANESSSASSIQVSSHAQLTANEQQLLRMGFEVSVVERALTRDEALWQQGTWRESSWPLIEQALMQQLPIIRGPLWECDRWGVTEQAAIDAQGHRSRRKAALGRYFVFMGPTGVGKTTTIGKIASRYLLNTHNPSSIALVSTDRPQSSSNDLLKQYAKQLGCSFHRVANDKSLAKMLEKLKSKALVLVDTAGITSNDPQWDQHCQQLLACPLLEPVLVLPSTLQRRMLEAIVRDYEPFHGRHAVISKLDESVSMGEALSTLIKYNLCLAYVTDGLSLADDLHQPKANELIGFAKHLGEQNRSSEALVDGHRSLSVGTPSEVLN